MYMYITGSEDGACVATDMGHVMHQINVSNSQNLQALKEQLENTMIKAINSITENKTVREFALVSGVSLV